jgi:hypothetical protein
MGARKSVWRLVVDYWPTPDGEPFAAQGFDFWHDITVEFSSAGDVPQWLPDIGPWLVDNSPSSLSSPPRGHMVVDHDPPDPTCGYPGYPTYLMNVPAAPTRRFFTRATVAGLRDTLIEWGCKAHIERAEVGSWEPVQ